MKNTVNTVTITRAEGPHDLCGKPVTLNSIDKANAVLRVWAETAPKSGAYDKCDFVVTFEGCEDYEGRYDLQHADYKNAVTDLRPQMRFHLGAALDQRPQDVTPERWEELRAAGMIGGTEEEKGEALLALEAL